MGVQSIQRESLSLVSVVSFLGLVFFCEQQRNVSDESDSAKDYQWVVVVMAAGRGDEGG